MADLYMDPPLIEKSLTLRVGGKYRTRAGLEIEILTVDDHPIYPFNGLMDGSVFSWMENGRYSNEQYLSEFDIIEEINDISPPTEVEEEDLVLKAIYDQLEIESGGISEDDKEEALQLATNIRKAVGAVPIKWKINSTANHREYVRRAQGKGKFQTQEDLENFLAAAIAGESGELVNLFKKRWRGDDIDPVEFYRKVSHEMADIQIYLKHLADDMGIDLEKACEEKVAEVTGRLQK